MNIISTSNLYNYDIFISDLSAIIKNYPFIEIGNIGYSVFGNSIPYIKLGIGKNTVFYSGAFHANEWITSVLLMKFIENFCDSYLYNSTLYNYNIKDIFNSTSIYIVPMLNPDGVNLVTNNLNDLDLYNKLKVISNNYPSINFPYGWKANFNGVDLNLQFPARLGKCKKNKVFSRFYISCSS